VFIERDIGFGNSVVRRANVCVLRKHKTSRAALSLVDGVGPIF
jgi:hypothetical protein